MTLTVYAEPLRAKPVDEIKTTDVLAVLRPFWQTKPETASRVRGRVERVLNAAKAKGYRTGETRRHGAGILRTCCPNVPPFARASRGDPTRMFPAFVAKLREREAIAALALEFAILTAARSGEVIGARWTEIDPDAKVWTIPAERMKAAREHRVPLNERAVAILRKWRGEGFGIRLSRPAQRKAAFCDGARNGVASHGRRGTTVTASVAPSAIGPATRRTSRASLPSMRLPTSSAIRPNRPTGDRTLWRAGATHGRLGAALRGRRGRERRGVQAASFQHRVRNVFGLRHATTQWGCREW